MKCYSLIGLGSGKGSTFDFFCKKIKEQNPPFKIKALITDQPTSGLTQIAKNFQIPCHILTSKSISEFDKKLEKTLLSYKVDLILLAGFLKKIGYRTLNQFQNKIINSHPSLLPEFSGKGMYGLNIHKAVLQSGKKETGISIHIVNRNYDEGPLLTQKKIPVQKEKNAFELEQKVKKIEKEFYFETVLKIINGQISLL